MTAIPYRPTHEDNEEASVWRCDECRCFHVTAGGTLITFSAREFERFAQQIGDCFCLQLDQPAQPGLHPELS